MKQVTQNLKTGTTSLVDTPAPSTGSRSVLISSRASLISAGTERMLVEFGRSGLLAKARQQPDKVKQVLDKIKTDGLIETVHAVQSKLDQDITLGYCNAGVVLETGEQVEGLTPGDRVASNGPHAEVVAVPKKLCAKIPDQVTDEEAAFTVLGSIALQGVRLAGPTLGESFAVIGLGLVGLLTVQILRANGCRVLGIDKDPERLQLAWQFGASTVDLSKEEDPVAGGFSFTKGRGLDGVLITAATKSNDPVDRAAKMSRKKGRIVLVGVTGLELNRANFYEKELSFQVSCSYGPGRYDPGYEEKGQDYPLGYVRWTEQRNFEAILELMASKKLDVKPLVTHRFAFEDALSAYDLLAEGKEKYLGIILQYPGLDHETLDEHRVVNKTTPEPGPGITDVPVTGLIGAGNYTNHVLLPALQKMKTRLKTIAGAGGLNASRLAEKYGFEESTSNANTVFADPDINTVLITTRHDSHAALVGKALQAGKNTFVEKPLCINEDQLHSIERLYRDLQSSNEGALPLLMVGFNRRFSPLVQQMKTLLEQKQEPVSMIITVNAGNIPADHWIQDPQVGGGRIIGEVCHFIDLALFLSGSSIKGYNISRLNAEGSSTKDTVSLTLGFANGSMASINYFANGHRSFPKERVELFCGGSILTLDNFKSLKGYGWPGFRSKSFIRQDKGHSKELEAFIEAVKNGLPSPIPFDDILNVTRVTLELAARVR